jgi:DNA (cytosine-5)-methyltransferase 1
VQIAGEPYYIADIRMRMLKPRELYLAQSFPERYIIDRGIDEDGAELRMTVADSVRMCGNSVPPAVAEALVRANLVEQREEAAA